MSSTRRLSKQSIPMLCLVLILAAVPFNSLAAPSASLRDISDHWAADYINLAVSDNIITGYPDGSFKPDNSITEAEFLALLLRSYNISLSVTAQSGMPWHYSYYTYAYKLNWPLSFNNEANAFKRGQAARMMAAAATGRHYTENEAIDWLLHTEISKGRTSATLEGFERSGVLTRAEALTLLYNMKAYVAELNASPIKWTTNQQSIAINDSLDKLIITEGKPSRIDLTENSYSWYVYNNDYNRFKLVGIKDNRVVALFTNNSSGISVQDNISIGMHMNEAISKIGTSVKLSSDNDYYHYTSNGIVTTLFIDSHNNDTIIGIQQQLAAALQKPAYTNELEEPFNMLLFDLTNAERARNGIDLLLWDDPAGSVAAAHSADMAQRDFFKHTNPDGLTPFERMAKAGINYRVASENIAYGYINPIYAHYALMNSTTGHRRTILNDKLELLGVGTAFKSGFTPYYSETFYTK